MELSMGIFNNQESDQAIDKMFASVLQASEVVLFLEFKRGYKHGLRASFDEIGDIYNNWIAGGKNQNSSALNKPLQLGYLVGGCVQFLLDTNTYINSSQSAFFTFLQDLIKLLRQIPGFDMNVIKKRATRIDVSKLSPSGVANLKTILALLSK